MPKVLMMTGDAAEASKSASIRINACGRRATKSWSRAFPEN